MELSSKRLGGGDHVDVLWNFQREMERKVAIPSDDKIRNKRNYRGNL